MRRLHRSIQEGDKEPYCSPHNTEDTSTTKATQLGPLVYSTLPSMRIFLLTITLLITLLLTFTSLAIAAVEKYPSSREIHNRFFNFPNSSGYGPYDGFGDGYERFLQSETVTRCNLWCKLKESLGLTLVGLLLICITPCLMWKNEGRNVRELRRVDYCKNKAVVVPNSDDPSDENTGSLVHFTGEVTVGDTHIQLQEGTPLNITSPKGKALIVKRTCYIHQKFEVEKQQVQHDRIGGGETRALIYTKREDWTPMGPQPEQLEHLAEEKNSRGIWDDLVVVAGGNENASTKPSDVPGIPPKMPPGMATKMAAMMQIVDNSKAPHAITVSPTAHVGGFGLTREIMMEETAVFQADWMPLPIDLVPDSIEGCEGLVKGSDGILRTTPLSEQPKNGDIMVKYEYIPDGFECSFVIEQIPGAAEADPEAGVKYSVAKANVIDDKCFGKIHDNLGVIWMVRRGRHELPEMINMAKEEQKNITKMLRILCYVLLIAGWIMIFSIFITLLSTLPLLGKLGYFAVVLIAFFVGTACCCAVTAMAYISYRPLLALFIVALGVGIWAIVFATTGVASGKSFAPTMAPV